MNIGVVTGKVSFLVVVDLDGTAGNTFGLNHKLTSTIISKTGNGKQVFYKWTEHVDNSVSKIAPGVDIRGDGGYVVVCPSIHPNGKRYRWERFNPSALGPFPISVMTSTVVSTSVSQVGKPEGWIAKALKEMKIGNIDDTLTSILGRLRRDGYTDCDAKLLLSPHAEKAGATEGHLEEKIRNIWGRYDPAVRSLYGRMGERNDCSQSLTIHSPDNDDSFKQFQLQLHGDIRQGVKTGFPSLDKMFEGGLKSERPFVIAARTGVGKTNCAIALSANLFRS